MCNSRMSVISKTLIRNSCRSSWNVFILNQKGCSSQPVEDCLRPRAKDVEIPKITLIEHLINSFGKYPDKIGLECGVTQRKYTYGEILVKSRNLEKNLRKRLKLEKGDVVAFLLPNIPEFVISIIGVLLAGLKITTINPVYKPGKIKRQLVDSGSKIIVTLPTLWQTANVRGEYLSSLRSIFGGAAPSGASDEERMRAMVGRPISILQGHGLTETSVVTLVPHSLQGKYAGSMGTGIPNTFLKVIAIDDKVGKHLPPDTIGELLIKGPQVMKGYHNQPEQMKSSYLNGWFKSGDLVRYDKDGMFYISDRIKEMIKVKAYQVAPAELEGVVRDFPGVIEVAVIAVPHKLYGEVPRAYVVVQKDVTIDVNKLNEYVTSKVAGHKKLRNGIEFVTDIPKNSSGKIMRRKLKLQYLGANAQDINKK